MGNTLEGTSAKVDVVIIGGGPTGLGAAYRFNQYGFQNWILLDAAKQPGGLAGSMKTAEGFRFDYGFKTLPKRFQYFDELFLHLYSEKNGRGMRRVTRDDFVHIRGRLIKYPLQNNLGRLPPVDRESCAVDFLRSKLSMMSQTKEDPPSNLDEHLVLEWGEGLCNIFFRPYIYKMWAFPTAKLSYKWTSCKIPPASMGEVFDRMLKEEETDPGWGGDFVTSYPEKGGFLGFWNSLAKTLPKNNVRFKNEITEIDIDEKKIRTKAGLEIEYNQLISSIPLSSLLELSGRKDMASSLVFTSLYVVCLGVRGTPLQPNVTGCIYFPESDTIFHRACVFSNRDPDSVPSSDVTMVTIRVAKSNQDYTESKEAVGPYWSLMLEVSSGPLRTIDDKTVVDDVIKDACSVGILREDDELVSIHLTEMTYDQPLPTLSSVSKIDEALSWLQSKNVWSRGRFGGFKYELGDVDQCFIQGVEAADNIHVGAPERCLNDCYEVDGTHVRQFPSFEVELPKDANPSLDQAENEPSLDQSLTASDLSAPSEVTSDDTDSAVDSSDSSLPPVVTTPPNTDSDVKEL